MSLRFQCVQVLQKILEGKIFFAELKNDFKPNDTAFANELILTALRRKAVIDEALNTLLKKKIAQKYNVLNYILLAASTELIYLNTPDYAVINEYVNIAKKTCGLFSSKMINAVLHQMALKKDALKNKVQLPQNFVQILKKDYTLEQIGQIRDCLLTQPMLDLSFVNQEDISALNADLTIFENKTVRLKNPPANIRQITGYNEGKWWVQDLSAALPVSCLKDIAQKKVLDMCAAPGGKTAQLLSKGAIVTALDISPSRLNRLKENISRLKLEKNLTIHCIEASDFLNKTDELYDLILLDAPCSATGTFRRHPEVLHIKTIDDVKTSALVQKKLLDLAAAHVKKGGKLLYATCSIAKDEGEGQIDAFLKTHADFVLDDMQIAPCDIKNAKKIDKTVFYKKMLRTLPYHMADDGGTDAFFAALLTRKENKC